MPSTISSTACLPVESPMRQWTVEVEPGLSSPIIRMEGRAVLTSSTEENSASTAYQLQIVDSAVVFCQVVGGVGSVPGEIEKARRKPCFIESFGYEFFLYDGQSGHAVFRLEGSSVESCRRISFNLSASGDKHRRPVLYGNWKNGWRKKEPQEKVQLYTKNKGFIKGSHNEGRSFGQPSV